MFVVGSFEYNLHLELAISELENKGIIWESIAAVLLDSRAEERKILDTIHRADGISSFDTAAILGTFGMLLGAIYGFALPWGPVVCGLIGLLAGGLIGLLGDVYLVRLLTKKRTSEKASGTVGGSSAQVVLIVDRTRTRRL